MATLGTCLWFDDQAEEAAAFYTSIFPGSRILETTSFAAETPGGGQESRCGWLKDRFGVSWQVYPEELDRLTHDPDRDRVRRATEAMLTQRKIDIEAIRAAADGG